MFHEKYLRDFLKVCENGNITAAAASWACPSLLSAGS